MFLEIIIALLIGILFGTFTGLVPGIHVNLVSAILLSLTATLLKIADPLAIAVFVISMAITHTFLDSIPAIFLGAPEESNALIVLPGHRLLLRGMGYEAVKLTVIGSLLCLITTTILIPLLIPFTPLIYELITPVIGYILLIVSIIVVLKEKTWKKRIMSAVVFLLSGILGIIVLNINTLQEPLLPLLSGIFGISSLLISLNSNINLPEQRITEMIKVPKLNTAKAIGASTLAGTVTGIFPGIGSAHAAMLGMALTGKDSGIYSFLILVGGANTVNFLFSLVTLYTLQKARNGAVIAVLEIIKSINLSQLIIFIAAALIVGGIATFLTLKMARIFAKAINKINYQKLCLSIIIFVSIMVGIFSGWLGLFILIISTALGLIPALLGIGRNNAMGVLLLPVILFFLI